VLPLTQRAPMNPAWRPAVEDDKDLVEDLVRVTVRTANLQRLLAEFPEDLIDAARRSMEVRSNFTGPADPSVAMWPLEGPDEKPE
jgi:hypothetical protein